MEASEEKGDVTRMATTGEGHDSRTAMETPGGSELFMLEPKNLLPDSEGASMHHAEISVKKRNGGVHWVAIVVYGDDSTSRERAERIVRAVNTHDELVAALTVLAADYEAILGDGQTEADAPPLLLEARAVLAKVK
jgi:hypothetical protein